jgi:hypothetical protein
LCGQPVDSIIETILQFKEKIQKRAVFLHMRKTHFNPSNASSVTAMLPFIVAVAVSIHA